MTWPEARVHVRAGRRARREGWRDRWVTFLRGFYFTTPVNAVTQIESEKHVVYGFEMTEEEWRAKDWTLDPMPVSTSNGISTTGQIDATRGANLAEIGDISSPEAYPDAEWIVAFFERRLTLTAPLTVAQLAEDVTYTNGSLPPTTTIPAGTEVESVLLRHAPGHSSGNNERTGSIDFGGREILGVLYTLADLTATDASLGLPDVSYPPSAGNPYTRRHLEAGDTVTRHESSLAVTTRVGVGNIDDLRVVLLASAPPLGV